ncbi:hypothetical protein ABK040_010521 [Willaertia magna]
MLKRIQSGGGISSSSSSPTSSPTTGYHSPTFNNNSNNNNNNSTRENAKKQEEYKKILQQLSKYNLECADCTELRPDWCSTTFGTFICLRCSGIHRSLGTHITFVKSMEMDKWEEKHIQNMCLLGNERARQYFEYSILNNQLDSKNGIIKKPNRMDNIRIVETYIKDKYVNLKYVPKKEDGKKLTFKEYISLLKKNITINEYLGKSKDTTVDSTTITTIGNDTKEEVIVKKKKKSTTTGEKKKKKKSATTTKKESNDSNNNASGNNTMNLDDFFVDQLPNIVENNNQLTTTLDKDNKLLNFLEDKLSLIQLDNKSLNTTLSPNTTSSSNNNNTTTTSGNNNNNTPTTISTNKVIYYNSNDEDSDDDSNDDESEEDEYDQFFNKNNVPSSTHKRHHIKKKKRMQSFPCGDMINNSSTINDDNVLLLDENNNKDNSSCSLSSVVSGSVNSVNNLIENISCLSLLGKIYNIKLSHHKDLLACITTNGNLTLYSIHYDSTSSNNSSLLSESLNTIMDNTNNKIKFTNIYSYFNTNDLNLNIIEEYYVLDFSKNNNNYIYLGGKRKKRYEWDLLDNDNKILECPITIFNINTLKVEKYLFGHTEEILYLEYLTINDNTTINGNYLITSSFDGTIRKWKLNKNDLFINMEIFNDKNSNVVSSLCYLNNLLLGACDNLIKIFNFTNCNCLQIIDINYELYCNYLNLYSLNGNYYLLTNGIYFKTIIYKLNLNNNLNNKNIIELQEYITINSKEEDNNYSSNISLIDHLFYCKIIKYLLFIPSFKNDGKIYIYDLRKQIKKNKYFLIGILNDHHLQVRNIYSFNLNNYNYMITCGDDGHLFIYQLNL